MTPLNPLMIYGALGLTVVAFGAGYKVRDWRCEAAQAEALKEADKQEQEMQDEVATQAFDYEAARTETYGVGTRVEREVRTIYRDVPAPPADCEPDARVIELLQERVGSANAAASGEPSE